MAVGWHFCRDFTARKYLFYIIRKQWQMSDRSQDRGRDALNTLLL